MGCDWDGCERTGDWGQGIDIKNDTWTGGRARNVENENRSESRWSCINIQT